MLEQRMRSAAIPGAAVALIEDGNVVLARAFGVMREGGGSVTTKTRFAIGSISKSMTATAIKSLADEGLVDPADSVLRYLGEADALIGDKPTAQITIANLVNHTSGYSTHAGNTNHSDVSRSPEVLRESARTLLARGPDLAPGGSWQYSNANYQILGALIETVTEKPFRQVVAERVFAPAQLKTAAFLSSRSEIDAVGHQYAFGRRLENTTVPGGVIAAQGGVVASIDDLARYLAWQMGRLDASGWRLRYQEAATVDDGLRYSDGWFMKPFGGELIVFHDGNNAGFTAAAAFNPYRSVGVVVLANASSGYVGNDVDALTVGVRQMAMSTEVTEGRNYRSAKIQMVGLVVVLVLIFLWSTAFFLVPGRRAVGWLATILPSAGLVVLAWLLGVALPNSLGATLDATQVFYPDAGWVLTSVVASCVAWALIRLGCLLWFRRAGAQSD